ncbi:MAG: glycosyltransferase 87 family protein [Pseudonocardiaceae bacterium]
MLPAAGHQLDLEVYRLGVRAWLDGKDMYGTLPVTGSGLTLPFIYPPFAAMALTPLVVLPWTVAVSTLLALSSLSLAVTLYVTLRCAWPTSSRSRAVAVTLAALPLAMLLEPVTATFDFGQINLILMALIALDCLAEKPRWPRGLLVGIAAAIKLTPAAFVLFFLLRRDRRATIVAVVTAAAATGIGFVIDGRSSVRYWGGGPVSGVSGSAYYSNESVQAVLARMGVTGVAMTAIWLAVLAVLLLLAIPVVRRTDRPLALVVIAGMALLTSPTSWSHHWVWIGPALVVAASRAVRQRSVGWAAAAGLLLAAFYSAPFRFLPQNNSELAWTPLEQVVGATYVIVAISLLIAAWWTRGLAQSVSPAHRAEDLPFGRCGDQPQGQPEVGA